MVRVAVSNFAHIIRKNWLKIEEKRENSVNSFFNFSSLRKYLYRSETLTRDFLGSLITNLKSELQNSKWRLQYSSEVHDCFGD